MGAEYKNKKIGTFGDASFFSFDFAKIITTGEGGMCVTNSKRTQKMLQAIKGNRIFEGMLIKLPKRKQDLRVDLPTIGMETLRDCKKAGIRGIVLKSKENIILDKNKCISFANRNKMFIAVK